MSVVTIPDDEFIKQVLFVNGFKYDVLVSGEEYFQYIKSSFRDFSATIIYGEKGRHYHSTKLADKYIKTYEKNYLENFLDIKLLTFIDKYKFLHKFLLIFLNKKIFNYEIFLNLKYNFKDKINFEKAKIHLDRKEIFKATRILYSIISKYNSDYRSCYRSFALLALIYKEKNDKKKLFLDLLRNCNQKYPIEIIEEIKLIK